MFYIICEKLIKLLHKEHMTCDGDVEIRRWFIKNNEYIFVYSNGTNEVELHLNEEEGRYWSAGLEDYKLNGGNKNED